MPTSEAAISLGIGNDVNTSAQIGDMVYVNCAGTINDGFMTVSSPTLVGVITDFLYNQFTDTNYIVINYTSIGLNVSDVDSAFTSNCGGSTQKFLSFKKDCNVNTSDILGYYAKTTFVNDDHVHPIELFCVNSQITPSSK
jgi:hypothetical protein